MKKVTFTFGRLNPPTIGHEKLANKVTTVARSNRSDARIYLSHTQNSKKDPLDYETKYAIASKAFGKIIQKSDARTPVDIMQELEKDGYTDVTLVVGSDRLRAFEFLKKYNGRDYKFNSINIVSAGQRDPDAEGVEGMSASKMRELAKEGNFNEFKKGLPRKVQSSAKQIYDKLRTVMEEQEDLNEYQVLNQMQRMKRARTMKRMAKKIARMRKIRSKRMASAGRLQKRSRKKAIAALRAKYAGSRGKSYAKLGKTEKMTIDKMVQKKSAMISKFARRMMPKIRKAEQARVAAARGVRKEEVEINEFIGTAARAGLSKLGKSKWWNKGRNQRVPDENKASWKTLAKDDVSQMTKSDKAFKSGSNKITDHRPLKAFSPSMVKTGPSPAIRQAVERPLRKIGGVNEVISPLSKGTQKHIDDVRDANNKRLVKLRAAKREKNPTFMDKFKKGFKKEEALIRKANLAGVSYEVIHEIYEQGIKEYDETKSGTAEQQAFNKVNHFVAEAKIALDEGIISDFTKDLAKLVVPKKIWHKAKRAQNAEKYKIAVDQYRKLKNEVRQAGGAKQWISKRGLDKGARLMPGMIDNYLKDIAATVAGLNIKEFNKVLDRKTRYEEYEMQEQNDKLQKKNLKSLLSKKREAKSTAGAGEWGTDELTRNYVNDTPGQSISKWGPGHVKTEEWNEERMDIIGQNGNDGSHYAEIEESDANWERAMEKEKEARLSSGDRKKLDKIRKMMARERQIQRAKQNANESHEVMREETWKVIGYKAGKRVSEKEFSNRAAAKRHAAKEGAANKDVEHKVFGSYVSKNAFESVELDEYGALIKGLGAVARFARNATSTGVNKLANKVADKTSKYVQKPNETVRQYKQRTTPEFAKPQNKIIEPKASATDKLKQLGKSYDNFKSDIKSKFTKEEFIFEGIDFKKDHAAAVDHHDEKIGHHSDMEDHHLNMAEKYKKKKMHKMAGYHENAADDHAQAKEAHNRAAGEHESEEKTAHHYSKSAKIHSEIADDHSTTLSLTGRPPRDVKEELELQEISKQKKKEYVNQARMDAMNKDDEATDMQRKIAQTKDTDKKLQYTAMRNKLIRKASQRKQNADYVDDQMDEETINEISKELARSYLNKATQKGSLNPNRKNTVKASDARIAGIKRAVPISVDRHPYKGQKPKEDTEAERRRQIQDKQQGDLFKKESVELDELSKDTLQSYKKKASSDAVDRLLTTDPKSRLKYGKRLTGMGRASKRLNKEETQIDEISKKTLGSYIRNASIDVMKHQSDATNKRVGGAMRMDLDKEQRKENEKSAEKSQDKVLKRLKNIRKASYKMEEEKKYNKGLEKACWKGYKAIGMKDKNGKKVPNCVPEEVEVTEAKKYDKDAIHKALIKTKNERQAIAALKKTFRVRDNEAKLMLRSVMEDKYVYGYCPDTEELVETLIIEAAEYQGKKVKLNDPFRLPSGSKKKFGVYVKNDKGNVVKVTFGDPNMEIKRDDPARRKAFRSRHSCDDNIGPKWKARYWSCYQWRAGKKVDN